MNTRFISKKRSLAVLLLVCNVVTLLFTQTISVSAASQTVTASYQFSDYFSETEVSNGPWSNQYYDFIDALNNDQIAYYKDMVDIKQKNELEGAPKAWISVAGNVLGDYSWGDRAPYVGAKYMRASVATGSDAVVNTWWENRMNAPGRNYAVKTFTAPESGNIVISALEDLTISGTGTHIRVMKISADEQDLSQVFPESGWQLITETFYFEPVAISVVENEKLLFECAYINDGNTSADTVLSWDPVVEYVISNEFRASEYFGETNPNGPWAAMYYDYDAGGTQRSRYKNMEYQKESEWINHDPTVTTGNYQWGNNSVRIGSTRMIADTYGNASDDEKNSVVGRDYPVRAFVAPNSGTITIGGDISTERENGSHIRIMKFSENAQTGTQIWPESGWENVIPGYVFEEITLDVQIGDMLTFENAFIYTKAGESPWDTDLNWDSVVVYDEIYPVLQSLDPEDGAANVPINHMHTLTFDRDIRAISTDDVLVEELEEDGEWTVSEAFCDSVDVSADALTLTYIGLAEYTKYQITISNISYVDYDESWVTSESYTFTTGAVVNLAPATYDNGAHRVSVEINNSQSVPVSADMMVFVCEGTPASYQVLTTYILQRDDIGENDTMSISGILIPDGGFLKVAVLKDIVTAMPYGEVTIIGGE